MQALKVNDASLKLDHTSSFYKMHEAPSVFSTVLFSIKCCLQQSLGFASVIVSVNDEGDLSDSLTK